VRILPGFSRKILDFSANDLIFPQIHRNTLENAIELQILSYKHRTESYPVLETILFLITTWRFGNAGALEGRKTVTDRIFQQNKKISVFGGRLWNQPNFPQNL
jgi:hypothetical protein